MSDDDRRTEDDGVQGAGEQNGAVESGAEKAGAAQTGADSADGVPESGPLHQDVPRRPRDFGIDVRRLRRLRLIVFGILALPLLALSLLAIKFVSMPLAQAWHDSAYDAKSYPTAIERLEPVLVLNWFEPYLPHLTRGTDLLQEGKDAEAEKELRAALEAWNKGKDLNAPQHAQCKILNNLAISIERQAQGIADPGARGDRLYEAETLLQPCAGGGGGGDSSDSGGQGKGNEDKDTTGENGKRVKKEREDADKEAGKDPADRKPEQGEDGEDQGSQTPGDGGAPPSDTPGQHEDPSGTGPTEEATTQGDGDNQQKKDELDERNRKANDGAGKSSSGGTDSKPDRPW